MKISGKILLLLTTGLLLSCHDLVLNSNTVITGTVTDRAGYPVAAIPVVLYGMVKKLPYTNGPLEYCSTGTDGSYSFTFKADTYGPAHYTLQVQFYRDTLHRLEYIADPTGSYSNGTTRYNYDVEKYHSNRFDFVVRSQPYK